MKRFLILGILIALVILSSSLLVSPQNGVIKIFGESFDSTGITDGGISLSKDLHTFTSADLADKVTNETGTGVLVFGTSPTLTSLNIVASITMTDDDWIGLGLAGLRIEFDDSGADTLKLATPVGGHIAIMPYNDGNVNFGASGNDEVEVTVYGDLAVTGSSGLLGTNQLHVHKQNLTINSGWNNLEPVIVFRHVVGVDQVPDSIYWDSAGGRFEISDTVYIDGDLEISGDMIVADDNWIGLSSSGGRIIFNETPTPDAIAFTAANVGINTTTPNFPLEINTSTSPQFAIKDNGDPMDSFTVALSQAGDVTFKTSGGDFSFDDDNITTTGAVDFGGATSLELPNSNNPTTDAEGEIAWDADDNALEAFGTPSRLITNPLEHFHCTIHNPDGVQGDQDAVPVLPVEIEWAPHGITLVDLGIKTDAASTYSVNFEEWTSPTDGLPQTLETVATSSSTEAEDDGVLTDASVAAGSIIYIDLPTTDIDMLTIWGTYYINPGD